MILNTKDHSDSDPQHGAAFNADPYFVTKNTDNGPLASFLIISKWVLGNKTPPLDPAVQTLPESHICIASVAWALV